MYLVAIHCCERRPSLTNYPPSHLEVPGDQLMQPAFFTEQDIQFVAKLLEFQICCRCRLHYCDHGDADHLFFCDPEDVPYDETN